MAALTLISAAAHGATFNVNTSSNLQSVIDAAGANADATNTLIFAPGTYTINSPLEVGSAFAGRTLVLESSAGTASTILDGGSSNPILWAQSGASGGHVIVDGLTLRNGCGTGACGFADFGGAIYSIEVELTVRNSTFSSNLAEKNGGAIVIASAASQLNTVLLHVENSSFLDNTSNGDGGALQIVGTSAAVTGTTFERNEATGLTHGLASNPRGAGGAILITLGGELTVDDCDFIDNDSRFAGGAVSIFGSSAAIDNSTFTGNSSIRTIVDTNKGDGGAIHCETSGTAESFQIRGNTITGNEAGGKGGAIHVFAQTTASTVDIRGNTISGNTAQRGGGIGNFDLSGGSSVQTVVDNVIKSNSATEEFGGAVIAFAGDLVFEGNQVQDNSATNNFPGLYVEGTECALIQRNSFRSNVNNGTAGFRDGAFRIKALRTCPSGPSALIENNFFYDNRGVDAGALAIITDKEVDVVGNTFVDNRATNGLGGSVWTEAPTDFRNNIFARHNLGVSNAYGIRIKDSGSLMITVNVYFNDFYQNELGLVRDPNNRLGGDGNFTTVSELNAASKAGSNKALAPSFVSAATGDLHLQSSSAVIDAGDCLLFSTPTVDIDGESRPAGGDCDIGADEAILYTLTVGKSGSGSGTVTSSPPGIACGGDCIETYASGSVVVLTPAAAPGSAFTGWSGDADCSDGQVTMIAPRSCTASFVWFRTLDVSKLGAGDGTVTSSPDGIACGGDCTEDYVEGTPVVLSAVPDFGSEFGGFGGPADCTDGLLGMLFDTSCTATFDACSIDSIVNLPPQNVTGSPNLFQACNRLTAGSGTGGFNVIAGATATFEAGNEIVLENGLSVASGVTFTAILGPSSP